MSKAVTSFSELIACHGCDLLMQRPRAEGGKKVSCPRCGTTIVRAVENSVQKALALAIAGLILFFPAVNLPIMTFTVAGLKGSGSVIDAVTALFGANYPFVGVMVLLVSVVFPIIKLLLLFFSTLDIAIGRINMTTINLFRWFKHLSEWGMVEVYLLGILVAIIKMFSMAEIGYHAGFFCFIGLVVLTVASSVAVDEEEYWSRIERGMNGNEDQEFTFTTLLNDNETAREAGLVCCEDCGRLSLKVSHEKDEQQLCPRCFSPLHLRKPNSMGRTWALVITAAILFVPANVLPIMEVDFMGEPARSTIMDGIIFFFTTGEYLVGGIILTASVLVPLFKIVGIITILLSIHFKRDVWLRHKSGMFRFIEFVGRWSFIDVFVIALLGAMVQFGALTTIGAAPAARYFTAVVISTMLAALALDPRIIWDAAKERREESCQHQS